MESSISAVLLGKDKTLSIESELIDEAKDAVAIELARGSSAYARTAEEIKLEA